MGKEWDNLQSTAVKAVRRPNWENGGGFAAPGIGKRDIEWPSFSATSKHGTANPTCAVCSGRLRGAKKCECPKPHDHWKPIGKRKNPENEGLPDHLTGGGMTAHLNTMQEWHRAWLAACYRVLVPGGVLKAFSATRTFHRMAAAMQEVGFTDIGLEAWSYGSGFPKSMNLGKALDKRGGNAHLTTEVGAAIKAARLSRGISIRDADARYCGGSTLWSWYEGRPAGQQMPTAEVMALLALDWPELQPYADAIKEAEREVVGVQHGNLLAVAPGQGHDRSKVTLPVTVSATDAAKTWEGWGTALKPSWEPVLVGRKPHAP